MHCRPYGHADGGIVIRDIRKSLYPRPNYIRQFGLLSGSTVIQPRCRRWTKLVLEKEFLPYER